MFTKAATAADFQLWAERARSASIESVYYVIKDCREAAEAMRGHNPAAEGRYVDEMCTYIDELNRRLGRRA